MGGDQEPRQAEQDRDEEGRTGMAAEGNPSRDCCGYEGDAPDGDEDTKSAKEDVVSESLDQGCPHRPFSFRECVYLVAENAEPNPIQRLLGAVENDVGHKRDSADECGGPLDAS